MRSLMFLLVLVLFCSVPMTSNATNAINTAHSKCCFEFTNVKVPVKLVKSYYWTSSDCPKRAIMFEMNSGKEFCVDPESTWVKGQVAKVDKRITSATTTSSSSSSSSSSSTTTTASTTTAKTQSPTV